MRTHCSLSSLIFTFSRFFADLEDTSATDKNFLLRYVSDDEIHLIHLDDYAP